MKKVIINLLFLSSFSLQAETSYCLKEKGHYILGLMGLKSNAIVSAKSAEKINGKYDLLQDKLMKKCDARDEDCSLKFESLQLKKEKEYQTRLSTAFADLKWCNHPDIMDNLKYLRKSKVKYCQLVDLKRETEIGESIRSLENEWEEIEPDQNDSEDCPSPQQVLQEFKNEQPSIFKLPIEDLCHRIFKRMKSVVSKCEAKKNSK
ncbi:MAG: hypothetical protein EP326_13155 [Deltaproteobacteria bacterium]|nr:MAG: hypothetical protein EP326_13155 [Deltaproteobacteria bacterium]TNF30927.1 MAG: hypothetical protein EP319_03650 [Deltaproteobacteria bacterium]